MYYKYHTNKRDLLQGMPSPNECYSGAMVALACSPANAPVPPPRVGWRRPTNGPPCTAKMWLLPDLLICAPEISSEEYV